jgi:hypothetical protein
MPPEPSRADEGARDYARFVRQHRRQAALSVLLALTIILDRYVPLGVIEPWIDWGQLSLACALIGDVVVRPVLRQILPTTVILQYGERKE